MPIGKNAIKRVENSGYSNVQTFAPDMENSSVIEPKVNEQAEMTQAKEPVTPKKRRGRPAKSTKAVKTEPKKQPEKASVKRGRKPKKAENSGKDGFERVEFGMEMPYWLL